MRSTVLAVTSVAVLAWVSTARADTVKLEIKGTY